MKLLSDCVKNRILKVDDAGAAATAHPQANAVYVPGEQESPALAHTGVPEVAAQKPAGVAPPGTEKASDLGRTSVADAAEAPEAARSVPPAPAARSGGASCVMATTVAGEEVLLSASQLAARSVALAVTATKPPESIAVPASE